MSKFHIFAAIRVPELWRHDGQKVRFYRLVGEHYTEITRSDLFPFLTPDTISKFLAKGPEGTLAMVKAFRIWVRAHGPQAKRRRPEKKQ